MLEIVQYVKFYKINLSSLKKKISSILATDSKKNIPKKKDKINQVSNYNFEDKYIASGRYQPMRLRKQQDVLVFFIYCIKIIMQDYKLLYEEGQREKRRLKAQVKKLEEEIRQRCQSFYSQMKKRKKKLPVLSFHHAPAVSFSPQPKTQEIQQKKQEIQLQGQEKEYFEGVVGGLKERLKDLHACRSKQNKAIIEMEEKVRKYEQQVKKCQQSIVQIEKQNMQLKQYQNSFNQVLSYASGGSITLFSSNLPQNVQFIKQCLSRNPYEESKEECSESKVNQYRIDEGESPYKIFKEYPHEKINILESKISSLKKQLTESRKIQIQKQQIQEAPFIIEEDIAIPPDPYVKRSFVRKKVIRRNLSTFSLPSSSQQRRVSTDKLKKMKKKIDSITPQKESVIQGKLEELTKSAIKERISEVSQESNTEGRTSDKKVVQVFQVETKMPGKSFYCAHIFERAKAKVSEFS